VSSDQSNARRIQPDHEHLVAELAALPDSERRAIVQAADEQARERAAGASLLGLMADAPELVDDVCAHAYAERGAARMRHLTDG
jgi:hypothetical protein